MDNKIAEFLKDLEKNLSELSEEERKSALLYYQEYLQDAYDSKKDLVEVFKQLGTPQEIASLLQAEESFYQAQKKPGIKSFNKAMRNAFLGISTPLGFFTRGLFLLVVYGALIIFMGGTLISFLATIVTFSELLFETFKIPSIYVAERLGTLGIALFSLGLFFLLSYTLFKISRWLMALATRTIRKMLRKKISRETYEGSQEIEIKGFNKSLIVASISILFIGMILSIASGLPTKLFTIFNSMKAENIQVVVNEYNTEDVGKIFIKTAHSCIKVLYDNKETDKIVITYEQPDWLSYESVLEKEKIIFTETNNGRLPLFDFVSLHESRTEVTLYLPKNFNVEEIELESRGGFVYIADVVQNIDVTTFSGQISLDISESNIPFNLNAKTEKGRLDVAGVYDNSKDVSEISIIQQDASKSYKIRSTQGNIFIR